MAFNPFTGQDDDPSALQAQYATALEQSRQSIGEPDQAMMVGVPMAQQAGEPDSIMLGPAPARDANILQGSQVQNDANLGTPTFLPGPQFGPQPQAPAKRGVAMSALLGFFHGLAGAGREHLMNLYEEENATRFTEQKIHANVLNNIVSQGGVITPQMGKAFGLKPDQVDSYNQVAAVQAGVIQMQEARRSALIQQYMGGSGPPPTGVAPTGGPSILVAGAPGAPPPPPPGTPTFTSPPPTRAPSAGVPLSDEARQVSDLVRSLPPIGGKAALKTISFKDAVTGATLSFQPQDWQDPGKRGQYIFAQGAQRGASYGTMLHAAAQAGGILPEESKSYGDLQANEAFIKGRRQFEKQHGRLPSETENNDLLMDAFTATGRLPKDPATLIAPTPQARDAEYERAVVEGWKRNKSVGVPSLMAAVEGSLGYSPTPDAKTRAATAIRGLMRTWLQTEPTYANNPALLESELGRATGYLGMTEGERTRADTRAPMTPEEEAARRKLGLPPLLERQLGPQPTGGPSRTVTEQPAVEQAMRGEAGAKGERTRTQKAAELAPAAVAARYFDTTTGGTPAATESLDQLEAGFKSGKYAKLNIEPKGAATLRDLKFVADKYMEAVKDLAPIFQSSAGKRMLARWAAGPVGGEKVLGVPLPTIPVLDDAWIKRFGISRKEADAATQVLSLNNTLLIALRELGAGEKGNQAAKVIVPSMNALPGFMDNERTANKKVKDFRDRVYNQIDASITFSNPDAKARWMYGLSQ